jgi:hypothetical protein
MLKRWLSRLWGARRSVSARDRRQRGWSPGTVADDSVAGAWASGEAAGYRPPASGPAAGSDGGGRHRRAAPAGETARPAHTGQAAAEGLAGAVYAPAQPGLAAGPGPG